MATPKQRNHPAGRKGPRNDTTDLLRLSDAARIAGVSKQTIEYYCLLGLITPIRPNGGRRRFFDEKLIRRIQLIRRLNQSGYTLRDIRETYLRNR